MRIGVFSYGLPVAGEKRGGIERVAHDVADGLAGLGHEVLVWSHDPAPPGARYRVAPLPWKRFATSWLGRRVTMGYLGNLLALLPGYRGCDAIIAHGDSVLLPLLGKPVIRVMHGSARSEARTATNPLRAILQYGVYAQEVFTAATQPFCVAVSENARQDNLRIRHVIPNGVDLRLFHPGPAARTEQPSILFVGTLAGRKRGAFLLDVFHREIRPRIPAARLLMVAPEGPAGEGVEYHSGPDNHSLAALYRRAWVYASPSVYEGFGLPYLEALASGTPVVASDNPGSREVLAGGKYGLIPADAAFGRTVAELLGDPLRRERMAAAGLARAEEFSLELTVRRYDELIRKATKGRRR